MLALYMKLALMLCFGIIPELTDLETALKNGPDNLARNVEAVTRLILTGRLSK